jgi:hypothetical protein
MVVWYYATVAVPIKGRAKSRREQKILWAVSRARTGWGRDAATSPQKTPHLPPSRRWGRRKPSGPHVIVIPHPPGKSFWWWPSPRADYRDGPGPADLRRSHRASVHTCRPVRGTRKEAAGGGRCCARRRGSRAGGKRDSVGVGPRAWRRCRVGPGEGDGSRARPMGARQRTARVAVGGGRFPIGCSLEGWPTRRGIWGRGRVDTTSWTCMRERFFLRFGSVEMRLSEFFFLLHFFSAILEVVWLV